MWVTWHPFHSLKIGLPSPPLDISSFTKPIWIFKLAGLLELFGGLHSIQSHATLLPLYSFLMSFRLSQFWVIFLHFLCFLLYYFWWPNLFTLITNHKLPTKSRWNRYWQTRFSILRSKEKNGNISLLNVAFGSGNIERKAKNVGTRRHSICVSGVLLLVMLKNV